MGRAWSWAVIPAPLRRLKSTNHLSSNKVCVRVCVCLCVRLWVVSLAQRRGALSLALLPTVSFIRHVTLRLGGPAGSPPVK